MRNDTHSKRDGGGRGKMAEGEKEKYDSAQKE